MEKELIVKIYKRIKELKLDENKVLNIMNLSDIELNVLLDLDNDKFKEKINTIENIINVKEKNIQEDIIVFNNNLKKVFKDKIKEEDLNTILNLKLTNEQLGKLIVIVNNVNDKKLDAIVRILSFIKYKRVKGDNIIKIVEYCANAEYSHILNVIITFLKKTELEPEEIVTLTKSMIMFNDDKCLKEAIILVDSIKDVEFVVQMLKFLSTFKCENAVKEACEIIKRLYKKCNKERIFELLDSFSKIERFDSFIPYECVNELAIKYPKLNGMPKIIDIIIKMQRTNRMYDVYNFVENKNARKHTNLIEFAEFIAKSESVSKSNLMSKMLINEDVLNDEKCLEYAEFVFNIKDDRVVKCACELVQNQILLEKDWVRQSLVIITSVSPEKACGIFGILNCNKLIEKEKNLRIAEMFINQNAEVVNFVSEKMLDENIIENEFFEIAIELLAKSNFLVSLDCVHFIIKNSNILGNKVVNNALEIVRFNEEQSKLDCYDDKQRKLMETDIIMLHLKLIEEVKQKIEFIRNYEENADLAIEKLEKDITLEYERKLAVINK